MSFEEDEIEEVETEADKQYMKSADAKSVVGFIKGLNLLAKHMEDGVDTKFFLGAEHDVIYVYTEEGEPKKDSLDGIGLSELGFHYDEDVEGWAYFT